ncbi:MAG: hypothetical protein ABFE07_28625 [Armatimonadia bacterium]
MMRWRNRRVALVGNGPSGSGQGSDIDACDCVVRQSAWLSQGPAGAGVKVSAICGFNANTEIPEHLWARHDWELWTNVPLDCFQSEPNAQDPGDWRWLLRTADGRAIRTPRLGVIRETAAYLRQASVYRHNPPYVDLGLACLAMALDLGAARIDLWGYDRTGNGSHGDDWAKQRYRLVRDRVHHDYRARAIMIAELVDRHTWCGNPVKCETVWHCRPEIPPERPEPYFDERKRRLFYWDPTTDKLKGGRL